MRRTLALLLAFSAVSVFGGTSRYLIATRHPARSAALALLRNADESQLHAVRTFAAVNAFAADLSDSEVAALQRSSEVRYISPVVERHALGDVQLTAHADASPYATTQTVPYGITMVRAPQVWPATKGQGVNVAILDTGIDMSHPDLAANIAGSYNTFSETSDATDDNGHGTHVAGTIAALDNGIGVVGVAPEARIWPVKVLDAQGIGSDENVVEGLDWVMREKQLNGGDWVVNLSFGSHYISFIEQDAVEEAIKEGIVIVAAAGNDDSASVDYPAAYAGVVAVGAVDSTATVAAFSNQGPRLSLVAPGVSVLSTAIQGSVPAAAVTFEGTTMSASTVQGSGQGEINGQYVLCGPGRPQDFPPYTAGKIALIERGELSLNQQVRNAQAASAAAVILYNVDDSDYESWTLLRPDCGNIAGCDDTTRTWPVVLVVSATDGQRLAAPSAHVVDMGVWRDDYREMSGTSMATPHVSGVFALVWSLEPYDDASVIRDAILSTAQPLAAPEPNSESGYGLVNAFHAALKIAPDRFGLERSAPPQRLISSAP